MRDLDREAVCEARNSMAGSVRAVEERAWVRDGERRSKRSGEQLPAVQSGKKQGKRPGKEPHLNARLWAGEILAEQQRCSSYVAAMGRSSRSRWCRAPPGSWVSRFNAWRRCEGVQGVRVVRGSPASRNCTADRKLTGVGLGDSGRCRGWGSELELREASWC